MTKGGSSIQRSFINNVISITAGLLVCALVIGVLFAIISDAVKAKDEVVKAYGQVTLTTTSYGNVRTIRHDNHLFVAYGEGGIIHHPSCPCLGRTVKVEEKQ